MAENEQSNLSKEQKKKLLSTVYKYSGLGLLALPLKPFVYVGRKFWNSSKLTKALIITPIVAASVTYNHMDNVTINQTMFSLSDSFNRAANTIKNTFGFTPQHTHYVTQSGWVRQAGEYNPNEVTRDLVRGSCVSVVGEQSYRATIQVPNENGGGGVSHYYTLRENLAPLPAGYQCPNTVDRLQLSGNFNGQVTGNVRLASANPTAVPVHTPRTLIR